MIRHSKQVYTVGEMYDPQVPRWPEMAEYNFRNGRHELSLFLEDPDPEETESIDSGAAHFALAIEEGVIFVLYCFEQ